jgi:hypothetical protein
MRAKPIFLCDPQCCGFEHVQCNTALLHTAQLAYPESEICFMGEAEHLRQVRSLISCVTDPADIHWKPLAITDRKALNWQRLRADFHLYKTILSATRDADFIIFCSTTNTGILALKFLLKLMRIKTPVLTIPHGGCLSSLERFPRKAWNWPVCLQWAFRLPHPDNLKFIALGQPILDAVLQKYPNARKNWGCLDLPQLQMYPANATSIASSPEKISFGFLGGTNRDKGFDLFTRLAKDLAPQFPNIEFELIGFLDESQKGNDYGAYIKGVTENPLSAEEYHRRLSQVTYCISTVDPKHYRWSASATFVDLMAYAKPGIFLRNPYVEYYFAKMGEIGYLVDHYDELLRTVKDIATAFPVERYRAQVEHILKGRKLFQPEAQVSGLHHILKSARTNH